MWGIFNRCSSIKTLPLYDTSNVLDFTLAFCNCSSLTSLPDFKINKNALLSDALLGCDNLTIDQKLSFYYKNDSFILKSLEHNTLSTEKKKRLLLKFESTRIFNL
jgi:hypothetical protein